MANSQPGSAARVRGSLTAQRRLCSPALLIHLAAEDSPRPYAGEPLASKFGGNSDFSTRDTSLPNAGAAINSSRIGARVVLSKLAMVEAASAPTPMARLCSSSTLEIDPCSYDARPTLCVDAAGHTSSSNTGDLRVVTPPRGRRGQMMQGALVPPPRPHHGARRG